MNEKYKKLAWFIGGVTVTTVVLSLLWLKVGYIFDINDTETKAEDYVKEEPINIEKTDYQLKVDESKLESIRELSNLINESAYYFTPYVIANQNKNSIYSPVGLYVDMLALRFGSDGETITEIDKYLKLNGTNENKLIDLTTELNKSLNSNKSAALMANAIFIDENKAKLKKSYKETMKSILDMEIMELDFEDVEKANEIINKYVSEKTNGLIDSGSGVEKSTVIDLMNVIYFKDKWDYFKESNTEDREFTLENNEKVQVPAMFSSDFKVNDIRESNEFTRLDAKLKKSTLQIIVPKENSNTDYFLNNGDKLKEAMTSGDKIKADKVKVYIPKFEFDITMDLIQPLREVGCQGLFDENLNLTNMLEKNNIEFKIGKVTQKSKVILNEQGVEAAAVTEIGIKMTSAQIEREPDIYEFRADRPFIFTIIDNETNLPLFIGVVKNPLN